jgi:hypothetical protein
MIQPGLVQNGAGDGYKRDSHGNVSVGRRTANGGLWAVELNGADYQVIGPLAGLPASRNGARRDGAAAGVNGKAASTTTTTGMNGQFVSAISPC